MSSTKVIIRVIRLFLSACCGPLAVSGGQKVQNQYRIMVNVLEFFFTRNISEGNIKLLTQLYWWSHGKLPESDVYKVLSWKEPTQKHLEIQTEPDRWRTPTLADIMLHSSMKHHVIRADESPLDDTDQDLSGPWRPVLFTQLKADFMSDFEHLHQIWHSTWDKLNCGSYPVDILYLLPCCWSVRTMSDF